MNTTGTKPPAESWDDWYALLEDFARKHGHVAVPWKSPEDGRLALWLNMQRRLLQQDALSPEQREKLARLKGADKYYRDHLWDTKWEALAEFHAGHGHINVPRDAPDRILLADWLVDQTARFAANTLRSDRLQRLLQLGWTPAARRRRKKGGHRQPWDDVQMLAELAEYKRQFGHCRVPYKFPENRRLAEWLSHLRYLGRRQALAPELSDALLRLGVVFGPTSVQRWEQNFAALQDYVRRFGDARVPQRWPENPDLGLWLAQTCRQARRGKLAAERRERLLALGVSFEVDPIRQRNPELENAWEHCCQLLEQFQARHGHPHVPYSWPENPRLASWCAHQLRAWRRGDLRLDRQERLQRLGLQPIDRRTMPASSKSKDRWDQHYAALVRFQQDTGHCRATFGNAPHPSLARWVCTQRMKYHRGRMDADRIQRLDAIGFLWSVDPPATVGI